MRRAIAALVIVTGTTVGVGSSAWAAQPGPGDKQCVPGHQGNPHTGHKAGVCDNR